MLVCVEGQGEALTTKFSDEEDPGARAYASNIMQFSLRQRFLELVMSPGFIEATGDINKPDKRSWHCVGKVLACVFHRLNN